MTAIQISEERLEQYVEDAKHSKTPWEFWEYLDCSGEPEWKQCFKEPDFYWMYYHRRKPDAPDWSALKTKNWSVSLDLRERNQEINWRVISGGEDQQSGALNEQVGGNHYKDMAIQPAEYIHANGIGFLEGNAIKYLSRWQHKGGIDDLKKAKHCIELLIELEAKS